ncbi:unnamed protein product [Sphagnum balticum]
MALLLCAAINNNNNNNLKLVMMMMSSLHPESYYYRQFVSRTSSCSSFVALASNNNSNRRRRICVLQNHFLSAASGAALPSSLSRTRRCCIQAVERLERGFSFWRAGSSSSREKSCCTYYTTDFCVEEAERRRRRRRKGRDHDEEEERGHNDDEELLQGIWSNYEERRRVIGTTTTALFFAGREEIEEEAENGSATQSGGVEANPGQGFAQSLSPTVVALMTNKPTMVALLLLCLLFAQTPATALAATGGRVGGSAFSSSSSQSGTSRSYSAPSSSASSSTIVRPHMQQSGGTCAPAFAYETDYITSIQYPSPAPHIYVGPAYGVNLGSRSVFFLIMMGLITSQAVHGLVAEPSVDNRSLRTLPQRSSLLKLQVGLLGMARTLQAELDQIAEHADTTTRKGLHYILTEACLALLRHPDYCTSGLCKCDVKDTQNDTEEQFNQLSLEERGKFDEETLVNFNSLRRHVMAGSKGTQFHNEYIVVTILVAAEGEHKLPTIKTIADLKEALQKLGSIPADSIQAVEVLWTPQDENDTLSERELLRKYPLLRSL